MTAWQPYQERIQTVLLSQLPTLETASQLNQAMRYMLQNGGKRLRPLLVYATGGLFEVELPKLDIPACAVELIHTYSLIHDDLPAMDNDDFRRGKPACHKAFGEAMAILTGDALQALAFQCIATDILLSEQQRLEMIRILSIAAGARGMVNGQALDLISLYTEFDLKTIENICYLKTGVLIKSCIVLALIAANIDLESPVALSLCRYAHCLGLAFQIRDDILDIEGDMETVGKRAESDLKQNKSTYASVAGIEDAKKTLNILYQSALAELEMLDLKTHVLQKITDWSLWVP